MPARGFPRSLAMVAVVAALLAACAPSVESMQKDGDVQGLVGVLGSDEGVQTRADAATALGKLGADGGPASTAAAEAVDHLAVALTDSEATVRAAAAGGLGGQGLGPGAPLLLTALDDEVAEVRQAARQGLATLLDDLDDQTATGVLIDALDSDSATVRAAAATGLGGVGKETAILPLLELLDDPATEVKEAAAVALDDLLKQLPAADVAGVLIDALDSDRATVRAAAATGLGGVGKETAILPLLELLDDPATEVKEAAANSLTARLAPLADGTAADVLFRAMNDDSTSVQKGANAALRQFLGGIGVERAVAAVTAAKAGDAWLAVALGVPQAKIAAETRRLGIQLEPLEAIESAATAASKGKPVTGAHKYVASAAFHPAVLFTATKLPGGTADRWAPTALRFLEIVVTQRVSWQKIEVCPYNGPDITRFRAVSTVRVVSAATGKVVAQRTYRGANPRACRQTEPYDLTVLRGSTPSITPAITWLKSLIHPPA